MTVSSPTTLGAPLWAITRAPKPSLTVRVTLLGVAPGPRPQALSVAHSVSAAVMSAARLT